MSLICFPFQNFFSIFKEKKKLFIFISSPITVRHSILFRHWLNISLRKRLCDSKMNFEKISLSSRNRKQSINNRKKDILLSQQRIFKWKRLFKRKKFILIATRRMIFFSIDWINRLNLKKERKIYFLLKKKLDVVFPILSYHRFQEIFTFAIKRWRGRLILTSFSIFLPFLYHLSYPSPFQLICMINQEMALISIFSFYLYSFPTITYSYYLLLII